MYFILTQTEQPGVQITQKKHQRRRNERRQLRDVVKTNGVAGWRGASFSSHPAIRTSLRNLHLGRKAAASIKIYCLPSCCVVLYAMSAKNICPRFAAFQAFKPQAKGLQPTQLPSSQPQLRAKFPRSSTELTTILPLKNRSSLTEGTLKDQPDRPPPPDNITISSSCSPARSPSLLLARPARFVCSLRSAQ